MPIFFANDSNESFLRRNSAFKKIAAQERFDFGDSKIRVGVNQSESKHMAEEGDASACPSPKRHDGHAEDVAMRRFGAGLVALVGSIARMQFLEDVEEEIRTIR
ncbi:hypothetical protein [Herbaspirillum lusitanum]|uniref:hypothetical protein n=1 Tax=Herbaspirillum lusitanum TaxID=213312 RepID=UPI00223794FE|nr:hypothetical protein [Herbaspirillum lusitanum]